MDECGLANVSALFGHELGGANIENSLLQVPVQTLPKSVEDQFGRPAARPNAAESWHIIDLVYAILRDFKNVRYTLMIEAIDDEAASCINFLDSFAYIGKFILCKTSPSRLFEFVHRHVVGA